MTDWIGDIRRYPIEQVAEELNLKLAHGNRFAACPACDAGNRKCSVHDAGRKWKCHGCGVRGDSADLVAVVATGKTLGHEATPEENAATRALAAFLGFCEGADGSVPPRPRVTPRPQPAPKNEPTRPPIEEVEALWDASTLTADEPGGNAVDFLRDRGYWPLEELDELGIVRMLPLRYLSPSWWPYSLATWRLVVRGFEATGELASLHARAVVDVKDSKMWPKGYQSRQLFMPNREGLQLLQGDGEPNTRVLVVEGLTGLLWTSLVLKRKGLDLPVLGATEGAWPALSRITWPKGSVVFAATDDKDKDGKGARYATDIRKAVPRDIPVRRWRWNREDNHGQR
ncbi:MAG: hypothetical protein HN348_28865 [Proteobacteria bacterium]|nr:hypothetical protein [Pseudomonadota bacterium]